MISTSEPIINAKARSVSCVLEVISGGNTIDFFYWKVPTVLLSPEMWCPDGMRFSVTVFHLREIRTLK